MQNVTVCDGCPAEVKIEMKAALHVIKDQNLKILRVLGQSLKLEGWVDLRWHLQLVADQMLEQVQVSPLLSFFLARPQDLNQP